MADGGGYGPAGGVAERADGFAFDFGLDVPEQIDVGHGAMSIKNFVKYFFHPAGSFTAWRTLSTAFVMVEAGEVPQVFYDAC